MKYIFFHKEKGSYEYMPTGDWPDNRFYHFLLENKKLFDIKDSDIIYETEGRNPISDEKLSEILQNGWIIVEITDKDIIRITYDGQFGRRRNCIKYILEHLNLQPMQKVELIAENDNFNVKKFTYSKLSAILK